MMFVEEELFRMDGLTGTNFQYHLLGDLMVDDDWTKTGESGRGKKGSLLQLKLGDQPKSINIGTNSESACPKEVTGDEVVLIKSIALKSSCKEQ